MNNVSRVWGYNESLRELKIYKGLCYYLVVLHAVKLPSLSVTQVFHVNPCRVFVLADPEVFSGSLGQVLLDDIEASASASGGSLGLLDHMRSVIQHSIQAALGAEQCHGPKLAQALKVSGTARCLFAFSFQFSNCLLWSLQCIDLESCHCYYACSVLLTKGLLGLVWSLINFSLDSQGFVK